MINRSILNKKLIDLLLRAFAVFCLFFLSTDLFAKAPEALVLEIQPEQQTAKVGEELNFSLSLKNNSLKDLNVISPTPKMLHGVGPGWNLAILVIRPDGSTRQIKPAAAYSMNRAMHGLNLEAIKPKASIPVKIHFTNSKSQDLSEWNVYDANASKRLELSGTYQVVPDVLSNCFDKPGRYRLSAIYEVSTEVASGAKTPLPMNYWTGHVRSNLVELVVNK